MEIRKITINAGASAPFKLLHMTDNHISLADERDNERKRELADKRANAFTGGRPHRLRERTEELLAYVRESGYPMVHSGDMIDFTSAANFDYARRALDGIDVMMAAGNHEYSQYVGEAWEDEAYKAQSMDAVVGAFGEGILFGERVINGVKIITLDNNYYYITEPLFEKVKHALSDGMPALLVVHTPLYSADMYEQVMAGKKQDAPPYLFACPEERLCGLEIGRARQQIPNELSKEFLRFCENCPNLKAVLAGHLHKYYASNLDSGIPQYVSGGACCSEINEYTIL